ncbi:uncharacterized protein Bfra_004228 [Botrytis fragariae]|uniref:DUF7587 domain-containing protein n=1 Tax=Botrytis fragariae TaxID=1964551 RepID=A0A8H6AV51_9HELO|nr:uncharacterized protein Bfra_004228 [Botrytis fragariae]KAF5874222.1 hypothetical protein Bfra_004228 [Botrytis fragariae]
MASQLFYRVYSPTSAGGLVCGKAKQGWHRPSHINLEREFENHKHLFNREPTSLVSVTSSIIRALKTAFYKAYEDAQDSAEIWIALIKVPNWESDAYHSAQEMAKRCRAKNPVLFKDEYLFEWEIPMEYVVHRVSVQTLSERGLNLKEYCEQTWDGNSDSLLYILPPTSDLRKKIASTVCEVNFDRNVHFSYSHNEFESHVKLAEMARAFGARAMGLNLSWKIFADCCMDGFSWPTDFEQRYNAMQEDCDVVLLDWWLLGDEFSYDYECHLKHAASLREIMTSQWVKLSEKTIFISEDSAWYKKEFGILMKREEDMEHEIEADAVRIGL